MRVPTLRKPTSVCARPAHVRTHPKPCQLSGGCPAEPSRPCTEMATHPWAHALWLPRLGHPCRASGARTALHGGTWTPACSRSIWVCLVQSGPHVPSSICVQSTDSSQPMPRSHEQAATPALWLLGLGLEQGSGHVGMGTPQYLPLQCPAKGRLDSVFPDKPRAKHRGVSGAPGSRDGAQGPLH